MDLIWSVVAVTIATFTVLLAVRHFVALGSEWVFHRYVAVGGLVAFTADALADGGHRIRFEVGGPGIFHNVTLQLFGSPESVVAQPEVRHTMTAGDPALEWTLPATAERGWVMVTWVRPYLQGVESEALARVLSTDRLYEWRWYSETYRYLRTVARFAARRGWVPGGASLRDLRLYGRWRRTSSNTADELLGPAATPPPLG